jgi:hypothetical protein
MSPPVTYRPAYFGLFASLWLAVTCNAYLDIQYRHFGTEVVIWGLVYAFTLRVARKQGGTVTDAGRTWQKWWMGIAIFFTLVIFLPIWGLPRAGLYALAAMQAALNCVTVDRRRFMMALTVSAVMVIFATMHMRADWTMVFYIVPYLFAVVFTLVAEQVSRRVREVQADGAGKAGIGGQGASILAATVTLLAVAVALFAITPQTTWLGLKSKYGQLSNIGIFKGKEKGAAGGLLELGGAGNGGDESNAAAGANGKEPGGDQDFAMGDASGPSGDGYRESLGRRFDWPSPKEMRAAARQRGMPAWQATTIRTLADTIEAVDAVVQPLAVQAKALAQAARQWFEANRQNLLLGLMLLILLAVLAGLYKALRELRIGLWVRIQADYLRFGLLGWHAPGNAGALQLFGAMERLFALNHAERDARRNAREYLAELSMLQGPVRHEAGEMTALFERARYGRAGVGAGEVERMRQLYRQMYERV